MPPVRSYGGGPSNKHGGAGELDKPAPKMTSQEKRNEDERAKRQSEKNREMMRQAKKGSRNVNEQTASSAAPATERTNLANLTESLNAVDAMEQILGDILPDMVKKLDSIVLPSFHGTEVELRREGAEKLVVYLSVNLENCRHGLQLMYNQHRFPGICELSAPLIVSLHKSVRKYKSKTILPLNNLPLFLELTHDRAHAGWSQARIDKVVEDVLSDIYIFNKTKTLEQWTFPDNGNRAATLSAISGAARWFIRKAQDHGKDVATQVRPQEPIRDPSGELSGYARKPVLQARRKREEAALAAS